MITGGFWSEQTEVVDLEGELLCTLEYGPVLNRENKPQRRGIQEFFAGFPIICGGWSAGTLKQCWKYSDNEWQEFLTLEKEVQDGASVIVKDKLLIVAGTYGSNGQIKTSQAIDKNLAQVEDGPEVARTMRGQCIVKSIDAKKIFVINLDKVYVHDEDFNFVEEGPAPNTDREYPGCTTIYSSKHDDREVLYAFGGHDDNLGREYTNVP